MIVKSIILNSEIMVYSDIESALGKLSLLFVDIKKPWFNRHPYKYILEFPRYYIAVWKLVLLNFCMIKNIEDIYSKFYSPNRYGNWNLKSMKILHTTGHCWLAEGFWYLTVWLWIKTIQQNQMFPTKYTKQKGNN